MLKHVLIVARKELMDALRDSRALVSALLYSLLGPGVVFMVSIALKNKTQSGANDGVLIGMMAVFTLVSAFVGGMSVAMDVLAGERERRSLLPLLITPITRRDLVFGKWLAISFFTTGGLLVNLVGFAAVFAAARMAIPGNVPRLLLALLCGLVPLALFAAAIELAISTICRAVKETQTYLSLVTFLPMGLGMFLVFFPGAAHAWWRIAPVAGQQLLLESWMRGREAPVLESLILGLFTLASAVCLLLYAANRLEQDDVVYGS